LLQGWLGKTGSGFGARQEDSRQAQRRRQEGRAARDGPRAGARAAQVKARRESPKAFATAWPRALRPLLVVIALTQLAVACAEPRLLVNGREIAGNTTSLIGGTSYAPGSALAQALGADLTGDSGRNVVTLQAGGRVLQL